MGFKALVINQETVNKMIELYRSGKGSKKIAKEVGISAFSVVKILRENGIEIKSSKRGKVAKISEKDYDMIAKLYKDGMSTDDIGEKYGVSRSRVRQILDKIGIVQRHVLYGKHRKHPINKEFFKVIDTEEKAYILGFLMADGTVSAVNANTRIGLSSKDEDHIVKIAKHIHLSDPKELIKRRTSKEGWKSSYIDFHSIDIKNDLIALGCTPRKSKTLQFPKLHDNMISHFMRGMNDGDGSIYRRGKDTKDFGTCLISTVEFIQYWNKILKFKLDVNNHIKIYDDRIWISEISGRHQVRKVLDFLYKDATIYLDRKYALYQQMCEEMKNPGSRPMHAYTIREGFPAFDVEIENGTEEIVELVGEEKIIWSELIAQDKGLPLSEKIRIDDSLTEDIWGDDEKDDNEQEKLDLAL